MLSRISATLIAVVLSLPFAAFSKEPAPVRVNLETTLGTVTLELDSAKAPKSVKNFVEYVKAGHYDGAIFHRVIPGFMAQGGGFDEKYNQKSTRAPIANESNNGLSNAKGTIAMARTSDPDSATAQFFINLVDNARLDYHDGQWGYAVFGKVVAGMDVVEKMAKVPTGSGGPFRSDVPQTAIVIRKASVAAATP